MADLQLEGKTALVSAAGRGIGRGIALALAEAGANLIVNSYAEETTASTAEAVRALGREAVDAALAATADRLGGLDILVNNAGVYLGYGGPVRDITDAMWRKLWSVNVDGLFYCCRAAARIMIEAGRGGRIINLGSTQAVTPGVGVTYDGSKAAVAQITKALALELAPHRINVNTLAPGPTWVQGGEPPSVDGHPPPPTGDPLADTVADRIARLPAGHWGDPMEQGKAAVFLASAMSDFVTGAYLPVDGGWLTL